MGNSSANASAAAFSLVKPGFIPPLDADFRPAALADQQFEQDVAGAGVPLIFGLQRGDGRLSRFETHVYPDDHPGRDKNYFYTERVLKFLLWQRGASTVYVGGPRSVGEHLLAVYSPQGKRSFDWHFMGEQVYEQEFQVVPCVAADVPAENDAGEELGRHLEGCRVGFDLGASDRKASAVIDGQVVFTEEVAWQPRLQADPQYHYREIMQAIQTAASKMPKLDAVGGSSAGIIIGNRPMVASLFRGVPPERFHEVRSLFLRLRQELNVPLEVINDGDVTALAGSMSSGANAILGIAMGSSQAAGYIDAQGQLMGWLNELAFAPIDYSPYAPIDEWSGDQGCGGQYFSQQCVFRLAPLAGIHIPAGLPDTEKLEFAQQKLQEGHEGALKIWQSMGIYLGYALAHYSRFYDLRHVLILGRCTSGAAGNVMLEAARKVLRGEFPQLANRLEVQIPDERSRRLGQSIAAASLPKIDPPGGH